MRTGRSGESQEGRRTRGRGVLALAAVMAALAGCAALEDGDANPASSIESVAYTALPLGPNLVDETCRAQPDPAAAAAVDALRAYNIFCGEWEQPSGRIYEVSAIGAPTDLLRQYTAGSWWTESLELRMDCTPGEPTQVLDGIGAILLNCRLRNGGWPYLALATSTDDSIYLADGIPAILPPMERAIGGLAGRIDLESPPATNPSAALERLEALLGGRYYGTGDLETYRRLMSAGQHYNGLKQFAEAEARYREALVVHRRVLPEDEIGRADVLMHLALELSNQQRYAEAAALFDRAEELLKAGGGDPTDYPRLVSYRALHQANQRQYDDALDLAAQATAMRRAISARPSGAGTDLGPVSTTGRVALGPAAANTQAGLSGLGALLVGDVVQSLYVEAAMLFRLGRTAEAEAKIDEALGTLDRLSNPPDWWRPQLYILRAQILASRGEYNAAERVLRQSIAEQREVFTESRVEARAHFALAGLYREMGRPIDALASFETAFDLVEAGEGSLQYETVFPYFETAMAEIERQPARRAELSAAMFRAAQLVRGTVTSKTVARVAARLSTRDPEVAAVTRALQEAQIERSRAARALDRAEGRPDVPAAELDALRQRLSVAAERVRELEPRVQAAHASYNMQLDPPKDAAAVIEALRPNEALVHVLLGEPKSFVFLVRTDGVSAYPIDLTKAAAAEIVESLRAPFDEIEYLPEFDVVEAHRLYRMIFGPLEAELAGIDHLITVPTGPLLSLPFGVLVTEATPPVRNYDYTKVPWLAERYAITVATSAGNFADLRRKVQPSLAPRPFIGFGDFIPIGDAALVAEDGELSDECRADLQMIAQAPPLPETAVEVRSIAGALGAGPDGVVLKGDFNEATLRKSALDRYRIVYLATHALLPGELDCWSEPAMLLSRPAAESEPGEGVQADGLLRSSEIEELRLDGAELVVLSGCNTGGSDGSGESLTGLARAFIQAGARSLLASHWVADSEQTVALMVGVFTRLADGRAATVAEALRLSETALMKDAYSSHPYYWGLFTVVGDGGRRLTLQAEG